MPTTQNHKGLWELFLIYLRLGCLSFGGPVAHMAYFKEEFVNRRGWLDDARYAELLGICQFVPGPSSSQLGFAIGWQRGGLPAACAAWFGFTLPSALLMIGFAYGLFALDDAIDAVIHGLLIAAVAVVANATLSLGKKLCPDLPRLLIAALAAMLVLNLPGSLTQVGVILMGALLGQWLAQQTIEKKPSTAGREQARTLRRPSRTIIILALACYTLPLIISLLIQPGDPGALYALHYRAGALVFGGGHVVLPLLNDTVVASGLVTESSFLAGYSFAQALPGPLFTFAAFLGTVGGGTSPAAIGGVLALIAIFLPGMLLLVGLIPFWETIRQQFWAQAALTGANAAVVGLLLSALIHPVWTHGIQSLTDLGIGTLAFVALYRFKAPAWLVVLTCGLAGYFFY